MTTELAPKKMCGIVMPISAIDGCNESHWSDVLDILTEAIELSGFDANLVSNADDVGIIHKRIIQNLYDNPVVVCDVSGKNPNVMFELGMRLAFDKPTIIVKDDKTSYSFDTSSIEHLEYPRDLRFSRIVEFKQKLTEKIKATTDRALSDPNYTTFLKHFGEFKIAKIDKKEISGQEFILEELRGLRMSMRRIERQQYSGEMRPRNDRWEGLQGPDIDLCFNGKSKEEITKALEFASSIPGVKKARIHELGPDHTHLWIDVSSKESVADIEEIMQRKFGKRAAHVTKRINSA